MIKVIASKALWGHLKSMTAVFCVVGIMSGCVEKIRYHGYAPNAEQLNEVLIGQDTRDTVVQKVGQPVSRGVGDQGGFYYIESQFRHFGALAPKEVAREIVAIRFNGTGTVRNIERFGLDDGRVITLSQRITDDGIQDVDFLGQLFGSFGAGTAADILGNSTN